jgi:hypothetical protein
LLVLFPNIIIGAVQNNLIFPCVICTKSAKWTHNGEVISVLLEQLNVAHIIKIFPPSYAEMSSYEIRVVYRQRKISLRPKNRHERGGVKDFWRNMDWFRAE